MRRRYPEIAVVQVERGVPQGLAALLEGHLDALFGLAQETPTGLRVEPVRREPVLVGMAADHPLASLDTVPVAKLADFDLLLPAEENAPEWLRFVESFCRQAGAAVRRWPGTTHGSVGAAEVVGEGTCVVPTVEWTAPPPGLEFRPLVDPVPIFPWSMMLEESAVERPEIAALTRCVRTLSSDHGWLR
jgi:DNA-binding transcriptional LysR family regulator